MIANDFIEMLEDVGYNVIKAVPDNCNCILSLFIRGGRIRKPKNKTLFMLTNYKKPFFIKVEISRLIGRFTLWKVIVY